jgi:hypothetical protein
MVLAFPRKHAQSLQRRPSFAFSFKTFAHTKNQASLPLDGLLKDYPTLCSHIWVIDHMIIFTNKIGVDFKRKLKLQNSYLFQFCIIEQRKQNGF